MKSIFAKYLAAFTVVLVTCISIILIAVSSLIAEESHAMQRENMKSTCGNISLVIENYLGTYGYESIYSAFNDENGLNEIVEYTSNSINSGIYVFDSKGMLVGTSDEDYKNGKYSLSKTAFDTITTSMDSYSVSTVDGFFKENRLNSYFVSRKGREIFVVLVSMPNHLGIIFSKDITVISVTVAVLVFLAAMISLYVVTRRTTQPLSEIVTAAKNYANGRFDYKIEVVGNDEVAELAAAINDMAVSLKHIDEQRNSFLGNVSHDLRTPMTTIAGFVDGILDGTIPPEKHEKYLNIISQEVRRLSRLVNTLLEVSRIESGTDITLADFNLSETARAVIISLESKISKKNIDIEFNTGEDDVYVNADPDLIHRVIFNLLDNAVKFTPESGNISINISSVVDRKKRKAQFTIRNSGEGIPKDELLHVFERFYKTDSSRGLDKSGTGLGLYIAKTTLLNHGEELVVDSAIGEYTEFRFTLPPAIVEVTPRRLSP